MPIARTNIKLVPDSKIILPKKSSKKTLIASAVILASFTMLAGFLLLTTPMKKPQFPPCVYTPGGPCGDCYVPPTSDGGPDCIAECVSSCT